MKSSVPPCRARIDAKQRVSLALAREKAMKATYSTWELKNITKSFCGVPVLSDVSLCLHPGETHSLLGCNGAGKSTLVRILSGHILPDEGTIFLDAAPVRFKSPEDAIRAGIAISTQELMLFPDLNIAENLFLTLPETRGRFFVNHANLQEEARRILDRLQINAEPNRRVAELSHSEKYLIQFARCWLRHPRLLILDELTASLTTPETQIVYEMIRELKRQGTAILYITQRTQNIIAISDRLTVLRDGKIVASPDIRDTSMAELRAYVFGETVNKLYPKLPLQMGEEILRVSHISNTYISDASFSLHRGEILGIMGNSGSGRSRLLRAVAGIDPIFSGTITYKAKPLRNASEELFPDIAYVPEDRDEQALFINLSCNKNITIKNLKKVASHGAIRLQREEIACRTAIDQLGISVHDANRSVKYLSGGNKQKVVIARFLYSNCSVYLFDEPTQGIDTAGKVEIYNIISELARRGAGIVFVSSDFAELLGMCDSILVLNRGRAMMQCAPNELETIDDLQIG